MSRPKIPAELKRRILVEAGHRCAIHTCRHIDVVIHHIIPWAECKRHEYKNLIALCPNCHAKADKGEIDRKSLRIYKANLRYAHDKFSQLEVDLLFDLYQISEKDEHDKRYGQYWPSYLLLLFNRILEIGYIEVTEEPGVILQGGIPSPCFIFLTNKGREYIDSLKVDQGN